MAWFSPFTIVNLLANVAYPAAYVFLLVVSLAYLKRYPKPALYFAIANGLLLAQAVWRTVAFQLVGRISATEQAEWIFAVVSLVALVMHIGALALTGLAVFSNRTARESTTGTTAARREPLPQGADSDRHRREDDFVSDNPSPYRPPRQPR